MSDPSDPGGGGRDHPVVSGNLFATYPTGELVDPFAR